MARCEICGATPSADVGFDTHLCAKHAAEWCVWRCGDCGQRCLTDKSHKRVRCSMCEAAVLLRTISVERLAELDRLLEANRLIDFLQTLRSWTGLPLDEAQAVMHVRQRDTGLPKLEPAPDLETLSTRVAALEPRPQALVAEWDGDTQGWFVMLLAVGERSVELARFVDAGGDMRVFRGEVPPWPEAREAARIGSELARRLGVPFRFSSPDGPPTDG